MMGGELSLKSEEGVGSEFSTQLTFVRGERVQPNFQSDSDKIASFKDDNMRVLIIDDIDENLSVLKAQLKFIGLDAETASSARAGLQKLLEAYKSGRPYHLLITDYMMPNHSGLDVVKTIRAKSQFDNLKILILSSVSSKQAKTSFRSFADCSY